jgi:hypothetical protein
MNFVHLKVVEPLAVNAGKVEIQTFPSLAQQIQCDKQLSDQAS